MKYVGYFIEGKQDCLTNAIVDDKGNLINKTELKGQMIPASVVLNTFRHLYARDMKTAQAAAEAGKTAQDTTQTVDQGVIQQVRFQLTEDKVNVINDDIILSKEGDAALQEIIDCEDKQMMKILLLDLVDAVANGCADGFGKVLADMRDTVKKAA